MAMKLQVISSLASTTARELSSVEKWKSFMDTAAWHYKYSFEDQVLIYAQRPDARACADFDTWSEKLNRRIKKGAKGIALLRERGSKFYLDHVFDMSDTYSRVPGNEIKLWQYSEKYDNAIIETLENAFGEISEKGKLSDAIFYAARNAVEDNKGDYILQLQDISDTSDFMYLDEKGMKSAFQAVAESSVAYMVMTRLNLNTENYFFDGKFKKIEDFNSARSVTVLGNAVSEISEQALREIASTISAEIKKERENQSKFAEDKKIEYGIDKNDTQTQKERVVENVSNNISQRKRYTDSKPESSGEHSGDREIRNAAEEVPEAEQTEPLFHNDDRGDADGVLDGNRQDSEGADRDDGFTDGEGRGSEREPESTESAEVGGLDEQPTSFRRRGSPQTANSQLTLFDLAQEANVQEDMHREAERLSGNRSAFSVPQQIIDEVLTSGPNNEKSILNICIEFSKGKNIDSQAEFLKNEYRTGGKGFLFDGMQIASWWDNTGLRISRGKDTVIADSVLSWEDVAKRINELLDMGRFAPKDILKAVHETKVKRTAEKFWYMHQDVNFDAYPDLRKIFPEEWFNDGFPKSTARLMKMVDDPKQLDRLIGITRILAGVDKNHEDVMRWKMYKPEKVLPELTDMLLPEKVFTTDIENPIEPERFITDDELHEIITEGFGSRERKFRTQRFFTEHTNTDERIEFLHNELGKNKYSFLQYYLNIKNQSFVLSREDIMSPYAKVTVKFKDVEKKISELVGAGVYLSESEREEFYPKWLEKTEKEEAWRKRRYDIDTYLRDFWRDKSTASVANIPKRVQYLFEYCSDSRFESNIIAEKGLAELIGKNEIEFAETIKNVETRTQLAECCYQLAMSTSDVTIRNTGYMLSDELRNLKAVSLHRIGDFYEIFGEEAKLAAKILDLQLTHREVNGVKTDMVGFPSHILEKYAGILENENILVIFPPAELQETIGTQEQNEPKPTLVQSNYNAIAKIASEVLEGDATYIKFGAGEAFMPLIVERVGDDSIAVYHHYELNGDLVADPDMTFKVNTEEKALYARSFQQDIPPIYQEVFRDGAINFKLESELNGFASTWFRNIHGQGYTREVMKIPYRDDEIEIHYNSDGTVRELSGEVSLIEEYKKEYGIVENNDLISTDKALGRVPEVQSEPTEKIVPEFEKPKPAKVANTIVYPEIPMAERHNFVIENDELGWGGAKEKFRKNMEAIGVLKECEFEHRLATPEEQKILSEYVGWGGLVDAFDETKQNWSNEFQELYAALTPEEYEQARASTLTSHYTSPTIIKSMYKALENMGFSQGNILEPSCGIGNFMGLVPDSMKDSKIYGIEIDSITGRIAQQLYQKNSVAIQGYEDTTLPDSFFDVAIGNVPFGDFKVSDKKYNKHNFLIHDFFFAKTLDKVRPGGIVAFITSSGTMDKRNSKVRQYIAQRADLVGAIRLPNNAFTKNAGTEVTADILFLQKRDRMTDIQPDWVHLGELENGITVNQYFVDNPDMILGEMKTVSGPFGPTPTCMPYEDADLSEQLNDAIQNIHATITEYEMDDVSKEEEETITADPNVRNFSFTLVDGEIYFRENSIMRKVELNATAENRIKGMIEIRDCVRQLIEYQTEGYADYAIKQQQEVLNKLYDDFTKKYGLINSRGNAMAFSDDSSYFLLCSLEVIDENGELERKADMFTKRTIGAKTEITKVDTASEALAVSIGEKAKIDMAFMSELSGKSEEELYEDLQGVIFLNPHYEEGSIYEPKYLSADEYLSGNVRQKLQVVKNIAANDETFNVNVEALTAVQPKDLSASEITVRLGSTWLPEKDIKDFVFDLLSPNWYAQDKIEVKYSNLTGEWSISNKSTDKGVRATKSFGTSRINAYKIIEETLNLKDVRIFDYVENEKGNKVAVLNKKETTIAQQKQELIKAEFDNWIWKSPERRERLTKLYNEKFNSTRPREYDGSHITFNGMNPEIVLRKHQEDAVARIMYGGNSLLGHVVGAGKTWTMVAAAMESKRLGLCNKSLFVVPNHLTEQWASEFLQLYPAANILVATKKDFETKNRKKFCGRIATGDYDAIIIGHSQFEKIPMSVERQKAILERQKNEIMFGIMEAKEKNAERFTVKQLEKTKRGIEARLEKLNDQTRKDDVVTFEELGVDRIFIDEAHYYKNLYLYTKMRNVGGIAQTEAQKSSDLFMKTQYLDEITGSKGVIFATGTPISNSMVELYTMQRYLQYKTLEEKNLQHFDAWASTFGETITAIELAPEGTGYRAKTRFAKFFNLPELMSMFKDVADIQTADMLNLPTPTPHYKTIAVEPTQIQKDMVAELAERAERVRNKMVDPSIDNMLKITNDGRKLALDQRLINPMLPDDENSKVSSCANEVLEIWRETSDIKGTQLVFCDLSTPKNDDTFNVYSDIREKLIANGVPENEIEFIHNADSELKKKELFSKVRKGDVRILLGSTAKMGAGTNVQRLLYASHDLDCPWRPADLEQRAGRIIRQGNSNPDVHIRRYVTKDTFDSYMWQLVENKQKFISQIMTSKSPVRSAEDIDETALSYAEIKALATGNPYIKEKMDLDTQVAKLKLIKSSFMSQKYELEDKVIKEYPRTIADLTERIKGIESDIELAAQYPKQEDKFYPMTIDGLTYFEKEKAGTALIERCKKMTAPDAVPIGDYRGFSMELSFDKSRQVFNLGLKGKLSYKLELGSDVFGNIQRIDNGIASLPQKLEETKASLEDTKKQFEEAKIESQKEFPQEEELQKKIKRLAEVDALLDMDKKDREGAEMGEPEENEVPQKKVVGLER